jgi:hypothetical protein
MMNHGIETEPAHDRFYEPIGKPLVGEGHPTGKGHIETLGRLQIADLRSQISEWKSEV